MYYSKRQLYALGETLGDSVTQNKVCGGRIYGGGGGCLLYTSPSPRDRTRSRMPSSA